MSHRYLQNEFIRVSKMETWEQQREREQTEALQSKIKSEYKRTIRHVSVPSGHKKKHNFHRHIEHFQSIDETIFNGISEQFQEYLTDCQDFPVVLAGTHYDVKTKSRSEFTLQLKNRFQSDRNIRKLSNALNNYHGEGVFLTLTIDPKKINWYEAWTNISKRLGLFMQTVKRHLGNKIRFIYTMETQLNSTFYPHIHMLILGIHRVADWKKIWLKWWKWGFIWINRTEAGETIRNPVAYMMKYIRKHIIEIDDYTSKSFQNAVLLWYFSKRQFNHSIYLLQFLGLYFLSIIDPDLRKNIVIVELQVQGGYMAWWRKKHGITYHGYY